jgi:hypothetical protein
MFPFHLENHPMKRPYSIVAIFAAGLTTLGFTLPNHVGAQGVISINLASDVEFSSGVGPTTAVGAEVAGVVPAGNWNDVPLAQQTNLPLRDNSANIVPGLTLSTTESYVFPATAYDALGVAFAQPGDTAMMRGHIYHGGGGNTDLIFTGAIPYANFNIIAY